MCDRETEIERQIHRGACPLCWRWVLEGSLPPTMGVQGYHHRENLIILHNKSRIFVQVRTILVVIAIVVQETIGQNVGGY